jgi:serine protease AprX
MATQMLQTEQAEAERVTHTLRTHESKRFKVKFDSREALEAALATESVGPGLAVVHPERAVLSVELEAGLVTGYSSSFSSLAGQYGASIVEDYRFDLEEVDFFNPSAFSPDDVTAQSLDDVIRIIGAEAAWAESRGENVILAIVDTGIDGTRPEFGAGRRHPQSWAPIDEDPWTDWQGHGSMCACIAAGSREDGGVFDGVAPAATILACRTHFYDTELAAIYDRLRDLARAGHTVIASNSFGLRTGTPPPVPQDSDFIPALQDAIAAGVHVFFSAGNYHKLAGDVATGHEPNSIWLHKSRADLMTVAASRPDEAMWYYSSRGPGQHFGDPNTNRKPDVSGVTPPFGRVVYGGSVMVLDEGWGTSGCCPQVAGLAALMLSKRAGSGGPPMTRTELFDRIRSSARTLNLHQHMQGAGLIDCAATVAAV